MDAGKLADRLMRNMMAISSHPPQKQMEHLHGGEMFILAYLMNNGDTSPSSFAKVSRTSTAHVAKALNHLEAKGEIQRRPDPADARKKLVSITPAGQRRFQKGREDVRGNIRDLMEELGEQDAQTLVRLTEKIARMIEEKRGKKAECPGFFAEKPCPATDEERNLAHD